LKWDEFLLKTDQMVFVSATPGPVRVENSEQIVEQISVRPPRGSEVEVRPTKNQIDDLAQRGR
jgi:excinuclease ABC subunit B